MDSPINPPMPTPDLPLELWLEVLSYLPRSALHGMIGVNRVLFELALDDKYEEIRFISDDTEMEKTFQQLEQFANIAERVKRLVVRPTFLSAMDFDDAEKAFSSKILTRFTFLNCFRSNTLDIEQVEAKKNESAVEILQSAKKVLKFCSNIQGLTVVLHDHTLTPSFVSFLNSLLKADSIGPRLRALHLNMTLSKLTIFLKPLLNSPAILHNLEAFSVDLAPSRFDASPSDDDDNNNFKGQGRVSYHALAPLCSFIWSLKNSLTTLSISTHNADHFAELLTGLPPHFPNLKKVELFTIFGLDARQIAPLFQFLSDHSNQLEELTIKPYPRQTSFNRSDDSYAAWISDCSPNGFGALAFSQLKSFDVGLREYPKNTLLWTNPNPNAKSLPNVGILAPNLRRLVMTDLALSFERIDDLISTLRPGLESIEFVATVLSPQLFDLFASKVPSLEMLAVECKAVSDLKDNTEDHWQGCSDRGIEVMRSRRYPHWDLKRLRISVISSCDQPHPSVWLMTKVAEAFPLGVEVDVAYRCYCDDALGST